MEISEEPCKYIHTLIPLNLFLASLSTLKAFKITMLFLSNIMQDFVYYNEVFENETQLLFLYSSQKETL